jgi:hypothetical protein
MQRPTFVIVLLHEVVAYLKVSLHLTEIICDGTADRTITVLWIALGLEKASMSHQEMQTRPLQVNSRYTSPKSLPNSNVSL